MAFTKCLLTNNSIFFAAALDSAFAEATTKHITLAEDGPGAFESFVQWLYYGIRMDKSLQDPHHQVRMWILADQLGCSIFQDYEVLRRIHHHEGYDHKLSTEKLKMTYEGSVPGFKLREFVMQFRYDSDITSPNEHKFEYVDKIVFCRLPKTRIFLTLTRAFLRCRPDV